MSAFDRSVQNRPLRTALLISFGLSAFVLLASLGMEKEHRLLFAGLGLPYVWGLAFLGCGATLYEPRKRALRFFTWISIASVLAFLAQVFVPLILGAFVPLRILVWIITLLAASMVVLSLAGWVQHLRRP